MFQELVEELLDLTVTEKGFGNALYAQNDGNECSSCTLSSSLCCCSLCWS